MIKSMDGQWHGRAEGDVPGNVVVEVDDFGPTLDIIAYLFPDEPGVPATAVRLKPQGRGPRFESNGARVTPVDHRLGIWLHPQDVEKHFPGAQAPSHADVSLEIHDDGSLTFSYGSDISKGFGTLQRSIADQPSALLPSHTITTWERFKTTAFTVESNRFFYRGQSDRWRLRTSFHRTRRKNLAQYRDNDVDELRRNLSSRLRHVFDPRDSLQTGAFFNLLQHHGYPTPLLDWSLSPFVAAYFAFSPKVAHRKEDDCVRLFAFDAMAWKADHPQFSLTAYAAPHFSIIDLLAIENPRMVPQQARATLTNVDDIETYLINAGKPLGHTYLYAIDLPISDRQQALSDLDLMGINAGALFPGVDGACEALRYKNFGA